MAQEKCAMIPSLQLERVQFMSVAMTSLGMVESPDSPSRIRRVEPRGTISYPESDCIMHGAPPKDGEVSPSPLIVSCVGRWESDPSAFAYPHRRTVIMHRRRIQACTKRPSTRPSMDLGSASIIPATLPSGQCRRTALDPSGVSAALLLLSGLGIRTDAWTNQDVQ